MVGVITASNSRSRCLLDVSFCLYLWNVAQTALNSISDFGHLLLLESYHLAQVFGTISSCQYFDFDVINLNFFSDV